MLRKFLLTIALCLLPLSFAAAATTATQNPPPIIGGTLLPGVNAGISQQAGANQGQKELNWIQTVFFKNTINKLIGWTMALAVVFLIIGGYQYLTAVGSDEQIKKAHATITWSLVGVVLSLLAFALVQIVVNLKFSTGQIGANLLAADTVSSSYSKELNSIIPCFGSSCKVEEIAALPQGNFRDEFLPLVARFLIYSMGFVSFAVFFVSGAILVFSWGEDDMTKKAKNAIVWGVTGIAFAAVSYILVKGISQIDYMKSVPATTQTTTSQSITKPQSVVSPVTSTPTAAGESVPKATTVAAEGGATCGGGKGICKNYGTGWSGCWAGYSTYAAGNADCRSERCCVPDSNSL